MKSLGQIKNMLSVALGSPALFALVNTRIMLRTGVDLNADPLRDDTNAAIVAKVVSALKDLGYSPEALTPKKA